MSSADFVQRSPPILFGIVMLAIMSALPAPFLVARLRFGAVGAAGAVLLVVGVILLIHGTGQLEYHPSAAELEAR